MNSKEESVDVHVEDSVQPKTRNIDESKETPEDKLDSLKKKAYIPAVLPEDFLRIILNQQQLNENNDSALAHRLQFGIDSPMFNNMNRYVDRSPAQRSRILAETYGRGRLQIDLIEAKLVKNYGLLTRMDPYVRLRLGNKVFETQTDYNGGKNPKWHKTVMAYVQPGVDMLSIEIFDEKSFTNDEMVAYADFRLPDSIFEGIFLDEWIALSGKTGEGKEGYINIQFLFTPAENLRNSMNHQFQMQRINPINSSSGNSTSNSSSQSISPSNTLLNQPARVNLPPAEVTQSTQNQSANDTALATATTTSTASDNTRSRTPIYDEQDLVAIKEMFPNVENRVIVSLLETNDGSKEAVIEALLALSVTDS